MHSLQYPPHITLAVYDEIEHESLIKIIDKEIQDLPKLTVTFESFSYFETPQSIVICAKPIQHSGIAEFHKRLHSNTGIDNCRPSYRPGNWIPHCTLATDVEHRQREKVMALVNKGFKTFSVTFDAADCAYFKPVKVLHEWPLPNPV